jgi:transcriptional regulator of acetoin/glycerol metabolism
MAIDNYLKEYRDYFFVQESYLKDLHDNISENDMYVILTDTNNKLTELPKNIGNLQNLIKLDLWS